MSEPEVQSRLTRMIGVRWSEDRIRDLDRYLATGVDPADGNALAEFMNGETYFFRYPLYLAVLQAALDRHPPGRPFRLLSAACSTGEEAYSAAFSLLDRAKETGRTVEIVGSDVRARAIAAARAGVYSQWSFRNLPPTERGRYFDRVEGERYQVREPYRSAVRFVVRNLLDPVEDSGFDAILLCNATLYMESDAARRVYESMAGCLRPDGLLLIAPTDPPPGLGWAQATEFGGWSVFRRADVAAVTVASAAAVQIRDCVDASVLPSSLRPSVPTPTHRPLISNAPRRRPIASRDQPPRVPVRPPVAPPSLTATGAEADTLWTAWANGALASAQDELRQRIFLEPESPLWRFMNGVVMWEQGWLARASREIERAGGLAARLPEGTSVAGLCTAAELRGMIEFWRSRHA